jgi:hypothetical protein
MDSNPHRGTELQSQLNESEVIPVTGRGGLQGYVTDRIPHCLDSQLTDDCGIVSFTHWPLSAPPPPAPKEDFWYSSIPRP